MIGKNGNLVETNDNAQLGTFAVQRSSMSTSQLQDMSAEIRRLRTSNVDERSNVANTDGDESDVVQQSGSSFSYSQSLEPGQKAQGVVVTVKDHFGFIKCGSERYRFTKNNLELQGFEGLDVSQIQDLSQIVRCGDLVEFVPSSKVHWYRRAHYDAEKVTLLSYKFPEGRTLNLPLAQASAPQPSSGSFTNRSTPRSARRQSNRGQRMDSSGKAAGAETWRGPAEVAAAPGAAHDDGKTLAVQKVQHSEPSASLPQQVPENEVVDGRTWEETGFVFRTEHPWVKIRCCSDDVQTQVNLHELKLNASLFPEGTEVRFKVTQQQDANVCSVSQLNLVSPGTLKEEHPLKSRRRGKVVQQPQQIRKGGEQPGVIELEETGFECYYNSEQVAEGEPFMVNDEVEMTVVWNAKTGVRRATNLTLMAPLDQDLDDDDREYGQVSELKDKFGFINSQNGKQYKFQFMDLIDLKAAELLVGMGVSFSVTMNPKTKKEHAIRVTRGQPIQASPPSTQVKVQEGEVVEVVKEDSSSPGIIEYRNDKGEMEKIKFSSNNLFNPDYNLMQGEWVAFRPVANPSKHAIEITPKSLTGTVVTLRGTYGFISHKHNGKVQDVFFHCSEIEDSHGFIEEGDDVEFTRILNLGTQKANAIRISKLANTPAKVLTTPRQPAANHAPRAAGTPRNGNQKNKQPAVPQIQIPAKNLVALRGGGSFTAIKTPNPHMSGTLTPQGGRTPKAGHTPRHPMNGTPRQTKLKPIPDAKAGRKDNQQPKMEVKFEKGDATNETVTLAPAQPQMQVQLEPAKGDEESKAVRPRKFFVGVQGVQQKNRTAKGPEGDTSGFNFPRPSSHPFAPGSLAAKLAGDEKSVNRQSGMQLDPHAPTFVPIVG